MTSETKDSKSHSKPPKSEKPAKSEGQPPKGEGKGGKAKAPAEAPAPEKPKAPPAPPRPPADPRLKFLKKFHGKFLPRGPLRDRHKTIMTRWNSGDDHGGVTASELKQLYDDWKAGRAKTKRAVSS